MPELTGATPRFAVSEPARVNGGSANARRSGHFSHTGLRDAILMITVVR